MFVGFINCACRLYKLYLDTQSSNLLPQVYFCSGHFEVFLSQKQWMLKSHPNSVLSYILLTDLQFELQLSGMVQGLERLKLWNRRSQ